MNNQKLSTAVLALALVVPIASTASDVFTLTVVLSNALDEPVHAELDGVYSCDITRSQGAASPRCIFSPECKNNGYGSDLRKSDSGAADVKCVQSTIKAGIHKVVFTWSGHRIEQNIRTYYFPADQYGPALHSASCMIDAGSNGQGRLSCESAGSTGPDP